MRTRALSAAAVAGQAGFVAAWIAGAALQPGYSTADQAVSELFARTAEHPEILRTGIAGLAPSYLATAALLSRALGPSGRPAAGLFLLAVPLLLVVLLAPLDCMTNGTATCAAVVAAGATSDTHALHNAAAGALQLVLLATPFAVAVALRATRLVLPALACGALGAATGVVAAAGGPGQDGYGIAQRATFGFVGVWVCAIAVAARRQASSPGSRSISSIR